MRVKTKTLPPGGGGRNRSNRVAEKGLLDRSLSSITGTMEAADERIQVLDNYRKKMRDLRELSARLKSNRESVKDLVKEYNKTEDDLKALQVKLVTRM